MAGRSGDGGHLQGGQHKGVGPHHGKQENGLPVARYQLANGNKAPHQEGKANDTPPDGMGLGQKASMMCMARTGTANAASGAGTQEAITAPRSQSVSLVFM